MTNILEIDLILNKQKYSKIYNSLNIIIIIIAIFIYVIFTYKFQSYLNLKGRMVDNKLEIAININDIKYISNNNVLEIEKQKYSYNLISISDSINESLDNYVYIYLKVDNLYNIDNYVYNVKIIKENKLLAKYIKEYL